MLACEWPYQRHGNTITAIVMKLTVDNLLETLSPEKVPRISDVGKLSAIGQPTNLIAVIADLQFY